MNIDFSRAMVQQALHDWTNEGTTQHSRTMKKYARRSRTLFMAHAINLFGAFAVLGLTPFMAKMKGINSEDFLPAKTFCTFGAFTGWVYICIYLFQLVQVNVLTPLPKDDHHRTLTSFQLIFTSVGLFSQDVFIVSMILHNCGQIEVLGNKFSELQEDYGVGMKTLSKRFVQLRSHVKTFNRRFVAMILTQYALGGLILTTFGKV